MVHCSRPAALGLVCFAYIALSATGHRINEADMVSNIQTRRHTARQPNVGGMMDKCMKHLWPDVVDQCGEHVSLHGACEARVGKFSSKHGGSCDVYCASFGFACTSGQEVGTERGCDGSSSSSEYLSCSDRTESPEAMCSCHDPLDTFLWKGAGRTCGPGKALVAPTSSPTCADYCTSQGLSCKGGVEAASEACAAGASVGCSAPISGDAGSICECAGSYDRTGAFKWPDKLEFCAVGAVLVEWKVLQAKGGTCAGYCESLRKRVPDYDVYYFCFGAWPSFGRGCGALDSHSQQSCEKDLKGSDAVCKCSFADL